MHLPKKGRFVVATRLIKAGSAILIESPKVFVLHGSNTDGCFDEYELRLLKKIRSLSKSQIKGDLCFLSYRVIKGIIKDINWKESFQELSRNGRLGSTSEGVIEYATIILQLLKLAQIDKFSMPELLDIISRISSNAFSIVNDLNEDVGLGLYLQAAKFNHSCIPNLYQSFDHKRRIRFKTLRDVFPGEELCVSYIDLGRPTWWRRSELLRGYGFVCDCERCSTVDPLDCFLCDRNACAKRGAVRNIVAKEPQIYADWLAGSLSCQNEQWAATLDLKMALPIPCSDVILKTQSSTSSPFAGSMHFTIACAECGHCLSPKKIFALIQSMNSRYEDLLLLPNDSSEKLEGLLTLLALMRSNLPAENYAVTMVKTELRMVLEERLLAMRERKWTKEGWKELQHRCFVREEEEEAKAAALLLVHWRGLMRGLHRNYPPQIPHPRLVLEELRRCTHLVAVLQDVEQGAYSIPKYRAMLENLVEGALRESGEIFPTTSHLSPLALLGRESISISVPFLRQQLVLLWKDEPHHEFVQQLGQIESQLAFLMSRF